MPRSSTDLFCVLTKTRRKDKRGRIGEIGELAVVCYLQELGYRILAKNWRTKLGELDLVCQDGNVFVVVEVKSRLAIPGAKKLLFQSITARKKWRLRKLTELYLALHPKAQAFPEQRIDVVGVLIEPNSDRILDIEHLVAAI